MLAPNTLLGIIFSFTAWTLQAASADLGRWSRQPADWKGTHLAGGQATLSADSWSFLMSPQEHRQVEVSARVTIDEPAKHFRFFGEGWSAWPSGTFNDAGFEAAVLLRVGKETGYRVQLSHKYQVVALVKYPDGGYVRVVPCEVKLKEPLLLRATAERNQIVVHVAGQRKIVFHDLFLPLAKGQVGIGVSSGAKATFTDVAVKEFTPASSLIELPPHKPNFSVRKFLGGRSWVFDGDEPILQLHYDRDPSCFAKLKPGYKPQLTWDAHWDLANQGAFKDADSKWTAPATSGGGETLKATWSARSVKDRFTTRSSLLVGYDLNRGTYTYDIDSELQVLQQFHFRYGFDFEHHTPLDPFRWQYLVAMRRGGELYHRPVYPIDPGPQYDLEPYHGLRVWNGRHLEKMHIAPAVEYAIDPEWNQGGRKGAKEPRQLNTAVCAAFYDTGIGFEPETAAPGTKIRVKYRYTGYPADEAETLFQRSKIYDAPTLDPNHHYIFADEWPKLTFSKFEPLSKSWLYGRTPFMTGHNQRPTYELAKNCGAGSGFAMKLGAASFAKAKLPIGPSLARGRYLVSALVKLDNVHGPGGRLELEASQAKTGKMLATARHYFGHGTRDWQRHAFLFAVPADAGTLSLALGNAGTGEMLVADVEFSRLQDDEPTPRDVLAQANDQPARFDKAPAGAIADFRMAEGKGFHVFNSAGGEHLHLANIDWVVDGGRPALRLADNQTGRKAYRRDSGLARHYFAHPAYAGKDTLPIALSGHHGGGSPMKGLTLAAWIKPAAEMGQGQQSRGDIIGYGARRFVLSLEGQKPPYQLAARINVNDRIASDARLAAQRWHHVALTAAPEGGQWRIRLFVDGKIVGEGMTKKFAADAGIVPSLILGAEIFYFHDAYYRGLIGRTLVFERALSADEIGKLTQE